MTTKKLLLCFFAAVMAVANAFAQQAWRVNNNPGANADFTQITTAIADVNVSAGDTLYIEPSPTAYTSFTLNKQLVIIGAGYFLDADDNAGLHYQTNASTVGSATFADGSQGSRVFGLTANELITHNLTGELNLLFEKCNIGYLYNTTGSKSGITIRKCYFSSGGYGIYASGGTIDNLTVENSIFTGGASPLLTAINNGTGSIFRNNVFSGSNGVVTLSNAYFANNIITHPFQFTFTGCVIKNNLFAANQNLPITATDNLVNVNMSTVFVGSTGTNSLDAQRQLKVGSPAIGAGLTVGDVVNPDCGAFGGPDPYVIGGIPPVPSIYELTAPISVPSGTPTMNVIFSARNNN